MVSEEFFNALLEYAHRDSLILQYARRTAARGALRRSDWDTLNEAREDNAELLHEAWQQVRSKDRSH